jgi:predicted secreted Zn-dependent protease
VSSYIYEGGHLKQRKTTIVAAAVTLSTIACASAPRNPVLDAYPVGVIGHTTVIYYDVHGRTFAEVRADMHRLGPKVADSSFVGETRSPMRWSWRTESTGAGMCSIPNASVSVNAEITLPRWTPPPDSEPGLAVEWNRFIAALETHEAGHKDISARAARDIVDRLRGLSEFCSQISSRGNELARAIVNRANEEQKAYDAATRHGITQGTAFGAGRITIMPLISASAPMTLLAAPRPGTVLGIFQAPLERVWAAMPAAYAASDLTINAIDSSQHAVGNSLTVRGRIGALPASEILDCGTPPTGRNADSVDVALFVTSRLAVNQASGTAVTNTVQAVAHPSGAAPIACRSRGVLERRLLNALRSQLTP